MCNVRFGADVQRGAGAAMAAARVLQRRRSVRAVRGAHRAPAGVEAVRLHLHPTSWPHPGAPASIWSTPTVNPDGQPRRSTPNVNPDGQPRRSTPTVQCNKRDRSNKPKQNLFYRN
eukprot:2714601-Pyramimonas_sp.AAC.1